MSLKEILQEVGAENSRAHEIWGGPEHDDQHSLYDWVHFMAEYLKKIDETDDQKARGNLIKIANLAVAAIESIDRKNTEAGQAPVIKASVDIGAMVKSLRSVQRTLDDCIKREIYAVQDTPYVVAGVADKLEELEKANAI